MGEKRVLIVDDEQDIVDSVKFSLELEGIECLEAYDGEEALALAKREKPDLIILDIMMPKMNGYKVARLLKFDATYKDIPIVMLTARTQDKDVEIGKESGAALYMKKPFEMHELVEGVKRLLALR